jgi:hypothetical protein
MDSVPESLRLYTICKALKFGALPLAGGIYDQHPDLIEQWSIIMEAEAAREKRDHDRRESESRRNRGRRR